MNPSQTKFVFFGTPEVSKRTLEILHEHGYTPSVVVTNPDAPKGRGLTLTPSPTKGWALAQSIPVLTPEKLDADARAAIAAYECKYALVVAYGKIFPEELIAQFPIGVLNVHYSLLPKYRGATPMEAALKNGDLVTGVTVQKMVKALDAGDILAQEETALPETETAKELRPRLIEIGANLLVASLPAFVDGTATFTAQDESLATRAGKFKKEDGQLDLKADARTNWNTYRAYADTIGTYFFTENGTRVKIKAAELASGQFRVLRVTPEGKSEMAYEDFRKSIH